MAGIESKNELDPQPAAGYTSPTHDQVSHRRSADDEKRDLNAESTLVSTTSSPKGNGPILPVTSEKSGALVETSDGWTLVRIKAYLKEELDSDAAAIPLAAYCFMTVSARVRRSCDTSY